MVQIALPEEYIGLEIEACSDRIQAAKEKLGPRNVILGHHYQRDEIIAHADYTGDSYKLAKDGSSHTQAETIVFCGVHFMAESTDILTPEHQSVILPNMSAGCSMADMANIFQVKSCWKQLGTLLNLKEVIPVTYINSAANLKAFVGQENGTVCTSTNAPRAVAWALEQGRRVLFFPDQHLGRNTGVKLGYDPADMIVWDPFKPLGGNTPEAIKAATFILWKGHCSVHKRFSVAQIEKARLEYPGIRVIVHPECELEVVMASDENGSTEYILQAVNNAPTGSKIAIGTEINLVKRLAKTNPDKTVVCLDPQICPCSTMYRIHPSFLLWVMENLVEGRKVNVVKVPEEIAMWARISLQRMLDLP